MYDRETGAQQLRGLVMSEIIAQSPDYTNLSFHLSGMIARRCRSLGRVGKIETFPILQICRRPSQTIRNICDCWQNLSRSGNSKISDRLGFYRHMRTICRENPRRSGNLLFANHPRFCQFFG